MYQNVLLLSSTKMYTFEVPYDYDGCDEDVWAEAARARTLAAADLRGGPTYLIVVL